MRPKDESHQPHESEQPMARCLNCRKLMPATAWHCSWECKNAADEAEHQATTYSFEPRYGPSI